MRLIDYSGSPAITMRNPTLGDSRTIDSGIIIKSKLDGTMVTAFTQRTTDIRLYNCVEKSTVADQVFTFLKARAGKLIKLEVGDETLTGLVSLDELEVSTMRPGNCGIKTFNLRIRVISKTGLLGLIDNTCWSYAILDSDGLTILDENGDAIYGY